MKVHADRRGAGLGARGRRHVDAFVAFLLLLGVIIPPIAAIYVIDTFRAAHSKGAVQWPAITVWITAAGLALLAHAGFFTLTTVPALDATLAATVLYGHWLRAARRPNGLSCG